MDNSKNEIQIFSNEEFGQVRTIEIDGKVYFVGLDVARCLGYRNPYKAMKDHVDEDDLTKRYPILDSLGRTQRVNIINESGLYSLILASKIPSAKKFKRWVTSEVIPSIKKTGTYSIKPPQLVESVQPILIEKVGHLHVHNYYNYSGGKNMKFNEFLSRLRNVKQINDTQYCADCPCCGDTKRHLYVKSGNRSILLDCKKGCNWVDIVYVLGLQKRDIYYNGYQKKEPWTFLRSHEYSDIHGNKLAIKTIYLKSDGSKTAVWQRYENGKLFKGLNGLKLPLYHINNIGTSGKVVFVVEGEKDVETLERLGYIATTSPNGAGSHWNGKIFNQYFRGLDVIVLSDNDDVGIKYSNEVVESLFSVSKSVKLVNPKSLYPDLHNKGDISDVVGILGEKRTIDLINSIIQSDYYIYNPSSTHNEPPEWFSQLRFDGRGNLFKRISNVEIILQNDEFYKGKIKYNLMSNRRTFNGKNWRDKDESSLISYLEREYDFGISLEKVLHACNNVEIEYHPIRDYISTLKWDGIPRLDSVFIKFLGCEDNIYTRKICAITFIGAIARIYNPGCQYDTCTVFVGKQGIGKSTFLRKISINDEWFTSDIKSFDGNFYERLEGKWIVELGEGTAFQKSTKELTKQVISERYDNYRTPYARHSENRPRQCIFIGTTNTYDFLKDETGDRRFYPIDLNVKNATMDIHKDLTVDYVNQLWAEALYRYKNGESIYINDTNILNIAERIQRSHLDENPLQNDIFNFLDILLPTPDKWYNMGLYERKRYIECVMNGEDTSKILGIVGVYKRERVSVKEIMCEFYGYQINQPIERKMSLDVSRSLVALGWNKTGSVMRIKPYGVVKVYSFF